MKFKKNFVNFRWIGEGTFVQKNKIRYGAFSLGNIDIQIGDFVLVRNDDALDPEDIMSCYVAQVTDLFDSGDDVDPYQARVQWFSKVLELPSYAIKQIKNVGHELEIVKDKRTSWNNVIDAETIFQKCEVLFLSSGDDYETILSQYSNHPLPVFFCRYQFTGVSLTEIKDKHMDKLMNKSSDPVNLRNNGNISHEEKKVKNVKEKDKSIDVRNNLYCAIPCRSPSKCPKVLIKRISDKVLESRNGNVRIFVADSNVEKIEDVADIFLNKLKLEKEVDRNESVEKIPLTQSFVSKKTYNSNINEIADEHMNYDSNSESATSNTPKMKKSINRQTSPSKPCKNLFAYKLRNSPRKNATHGHADIYTSPVKKAKVSILNERSAVFLKNSESSDEDAKDYIRPSLRKSSSKSKENRHKDSTSVSGKLCSLNGNCETKDELMISYPDMKSTLGTPKTKKKTSNNIVRTPSQKASKSVTLASKKPSDQNSASEKNDTCSTPKKKAKFTDVIEDFCLTRSGRRVKSVNYSEQQIGTVVNTTTPTKKLPSYIRSSCSEDSDSSKYSASEATADDDSLSGVSLLDETSPTKRKRMSKKTKAASKKSNNVNVRTPSSRKSVINLSIPERKTPLRAPKNALEESRQRLHVSAVPNSLPCRDEEYSDIYSFVKGCLCAQTGGCMYISGVPGTGKTATVHEVIRNLEEEKESGEIPMFTFVEVNGMWMTDPYQCYVQIFKALTGKSIAPQQAADLLEKRFTERGPKKDAVVLLVDELDRLWTRKQTVMYNIFDWPSKKYSKLIVLAIANTMDLPERMMMNRISSRLGLTRKTFQPYTFRQLQEIIMSRIQELKVFDPDAVQLVARKVAAVSGDARRALDICRFATETVKVGQTTKKGQKMLVGMEHVDTALQQMFSSPVISAIRSASKIAKLFFQCILSEFTRTGLEETTLLKVHRQVISTCRFEGLHPPNSTEISRICADLAASHLILVDNFRNELYMKIRLNISSDDVTYALTLK